MIISPEPFDLDRATPGVATIRYLSDELSSLRSYTDRLIVAADHREAQLAEAWDEVERLRGVVERLELEKFALAEELVRLRGLSKGTNPATTVVDSPVAVGRTRGTR